MKKVMLIALMGLFTISMFAQTPEKTKPADKKKEAPKTEMSKPATPSKETAKPAKSGHHTEKKQVTPPKK